MNGGRHYRTPAPGARPHARRTPPPRRVHRPRHRAPTAPSALRGPASSPAATGPTAPGPRTLGGGSSPPTRRSVRGGNRLASWPAQSSRSNGRRRFLRLLAGGPRRLGLGEVAASLGLAKGHRPRHPAHAPARGLRGTGRGDRQVPARRRPAAPGHQLSGRQRAALALHQLGRRAGRAQRRGRCAWGPRWRARSSSCTTCSGRTTPSRRWTWARCCRCTPPRSARCCWRSGPRPWSPAGEPGLEAYTRHTLVDPERLARALTEVREVGWAAEIQEMSMGEAGLAAPIRGTAASSSAPSGCPGRSSGSATARGKPARL